MPQYAAVRSSGNNNSSRVDPLLPSGWKVDNGEPVVTLSVNVFPRSLEVAAGNAQPEVSMESSHCLTKAGGLYQYNGKCRMMVDACVMRA